jgi:RNA polymerase sigma factor (sigma-70 family)
VNEVVAKSDLTSRLWMEYQRRRDPARDAERERLILAHLHLVEKLTREQGRIFRHADPRDLYQVGCIGLCEAADRYQPNAGRFEAFAYFRVRGAIIDSCKRRAFRDAWHESIDGFATEHDGWIPPALDTCPLPLPDEMLEREQLVSFLKSALTALPAADRYLLVAWSEGAPIREQCRISGMSPNYTRDRVAQLQARLRATMTRPAPARRAA